MVAGMERYYQIARCYRDEDFRADRQPEFTQLDVEMSFVEQDDVIAVAEDVLREVWALIDYELPTPIARMTYHDAMEKYGSDKPDLRFGCELVDLTDYFKEMGIKVKYMHSDIKTLERTEIIRDLRLGVFDVLVGINLLREGIDVPEVSLVAILDADKEGFLRNERGLIQTIGRAARNSEGHVIMYADTVTQSMQRAIDETARRRKIQMAYNEEHGIVPQTIKKEIRDLIAVTKAVAKEEDKEVDINSLNKQERKELVKKLEKQMQEAVEVLDFELAAQIRDMMLEVKALD